MDDDDELYDEFGNYIGPDIDDEDDEDEDDLRAARAQRGAEDDGDADAAMADGAAEDAADAGAAPMDAEPLEEDRVVLHEDKQYYPTLREVYGDGVETTVQEEDAQPITEPIIKPVKVRDFDLVEKGVPETSYAPEYLVDLLAHPPLVRNVAVIGHLHHGKTTLMDMLIAESHPHIAGGGVAGGSAPTERAAPEGEAPRKRSNASRRAHDPERAFREVRYTDSRRDEQARGMSIKAAPISLVLRTGGARAKSYAVNLCDAPGHTAFGDEMSAALRLADGALLVVDCVEGVLMTTERAIRQAAVEGVRIILVLNKIDRLVTELRLPPADAYHKLRQLVGQVNDLIAQAAVDAAAAAAGGDGAPPDRLRVLTAFVQVRLGNTPEAEALLDAVPEDRTPTDLAADAHFLRGVCHTRSGREEEAIGALERALEADEGHWRARFQLAVIAVRWEMYEDARTLLAEVQALNPSHEQSAEILAKLDALEEARALDEADQAQAEAAAAQARAHLNAQGGLPDDAAIAAELDEDDWRDLERMAKAGEGEQEGDEKKP